MAGEVAMAVVWWLLLGSWELEVGGEVGEDGLWSCLGDAGPVVEAVAPIRWS
jgi:hypothetical protein